MWVFEYFKETTYYIASIHQFLVVHYWLILQFGRNWHRTSSTMRSTCFWGLEVFVWFFWKYELCNGDLVNFWSNYICEQVFL